jgi:hypothetical protein
MFGCSRKTHKPALTRVEEVRVVERYETLSVYVPLAETVRVQGQAYVVKYDTLRNVVQLTHVQRVPFVAETVRSYIPIVTPVPQPVETPPPAARTWWPGWLVLGLIAIAVIVYAVSRR